MKIKVYFTSSALEKLALGREPYYWDFSVRREEDEPPKDGFLAFESGEVFLPSREVATRIAVETLRAKKQQIYLDAAKEAGELDVKIQNLLALGGS